MFTNDKLFTIQRLLFGDSTVPTCPVDTTELTLTDKCHVGKISIFGYLSSHNVWRANSGTALFSFWIWAPKAWCLFYKRNVLAYRDLEQMEPKVIWLSPSKTENWSFYYITVHNFGAP